MNDLAYYYVNHDRSYIALAYQSIESFRKYNGSISIVLFADRSCCDSLRRHFKFERFEIVETDLPSSNIYLNKWRVLDRVIECNPARALYVDCDTIFYSDAIGLFDFIADCNMAARLEGQTDFDRQPCELDRVKYDALLKRYNARLVPVFNTGMMAMDARAIRAVRDGLATVISLLKEWAATARSYPGINKHIADEVALAIYLGSIKDLSWKLMTSQAVPFFYEISRGRRRDLGIVVHYWNAYASLRSPNPYADAEGSRPVPDQRGWLP